MPLKTDRTPQIIGSFKNSTINELQIRRWWKKWPEAGVGIATGVKSSICVVDVDPRNGGLKTIQRLSEDDKRTDFVKHLKSTLQVATGGGGHHYYVDLRDPFVTDLTYNIQSGNHRLGEGIDLKSDGGYVVAPPTIHDKTGKPYVWADFNAQPLRIAANEARFLGHKELNKEFDTQKKYQGKEMIHKRNISLMYQAQEVLYPGTDLLDSKSKKWLYCDPKSQGRMLDLLGFENYQSVFTKGRASVKSVLSEDNHPSAGVERIDSGEILFRDFRIDGKSFTLPELLSIQVSGERRQRGKMEFAVWSTRLLIQSGVIESPAVGLPPLVGETTAAMKTFHAGVKLLFECQWKYVGTANAPVPIARRFMADWCGISEASAQRAKSHLLKTGVIRSSQKHYGPYQAWTFLPGRS